MKKLQKGFTLIELMTVVAIIAILAAVAAPKFGLQIKKAQDAKGIQIVGNWRSALTMKYADDQVYPTAFSQLASNVDDKTIAATYNVNGTDVLDKAQRTASVNVGTGFKGKDNKLFAQFQIQGTTTESSINFTGTGVDTKGTSWSAY
mgnify:CR=1 FL=1